MKTKFPYYLLFLVLVLLSEPQLFAQNTQSENDTIYHYEDAYFYKQQQFYKKWKQRAAKHKWSKEIFNLLFHPPTTTTPQRFKTQKSRASALKEYEGRIIESINFNIVRPFGQYVDGLPTDSTDNKLERWGNRIHMRTREKHLLRLLSFKTGEQLDIKQLEDNEETLAGLPYVDEVYISAIEISPKNIQLKFIIKERFSWGLSYQAHSFNAHKIKLYNKNLFGIGHYSKLNYFYTPNKAIVNNIEFEYTVPSIGKSRISSSGIFEHNNSHDRYSWELYKSFIDYKSKYAGGVRYNLLRRASGVPTNAIASFPNTIDYLETESWLGISIPYNLKKDDIYARYRKAITGKIYRIRFTKRPEIKIDSNRFLLNTTGALLAYNVSKKKLCLSNMIYNYGKVENIPYGHLAQLFIGGAFNQWQRKAYFGANFEKAYYSTANDYYLSFRLSGGTFFNREGFLDGLVDSQLKYISKLYRFRNTGHRHFLKLHYILGFNVADDFLNINRSNGIRNFSSSIAKGNRKISLNIEDVFFSPYVIAGFRSTFFSFADVAYISRGNKLFRNTGHLYAGVGLGLRLQNKNFVFKTFQLSFSFFLKSPSDVNYWKFRSGGVSAEGFRNMHIDKPYFYFEEDSFK